MLTSKKLVDESDPTWNDETVFDYEIGEPVHFRVFDSNEVFGSNAFREDDRIGFVRAGVDGTPAEGTFTRPLRERFGESATLTFAIAFAPHAEVGVKDKPDDIIIPPADAHVYYQLVTCVAEPTINLMLSSHPVLSAAFSLTMEYLDSEAGGSFDLRDAATNITVNQLAHQIQKRINKPVDAVVSVTQAAQCTYDVLRKQ